MPDILEQEATIVRLKRELNTARHDLIRAGAVFSSIGEGVIVTDEYGRIEQVNKCCLDILGYKHKDVLGKRFVDVIRAVNEDGSAINAMDRPITRAFLSGQPISERMFYLTKDNTSIPIDLNISPIISHDSPVGAIEVFRDLSDEYVKDKIQGEFISIASHQLRTPLSSINTYSQMLSQGYGGELSERQADFVSVIENSANRMNELIHTLLNVTRIEAGNIAVNVKSVKVDDICQEVIGLLKLMAKEKNISINYQNLSVTQIETDPILFREVLSNLLSNAVKYTQNGGRIWLKVKMNNRIILSVKDNGYGIPERAKPYVFSKFYRASNAAAYDVSGTGIGLYLARQVAEVLEGDLWFTSEVGKGSTFFFSLPLLGSARKHGKFTLEVPG